MTVHPPDPPVAALATVSGVSTVAAVRVSGVGCVESVGRLFSPERGGGTKCSRELPSAERGSLLLTSKLEIPATLVRYPQGRSYTGEESVELLIPGAPGVSGALLSALEREGIYPAGPGEFTRRAFCNGRIDLTGAESVAALIAAESLEDAQAARRTLDGHLAEGVRELADQLHDTIALLEAGLDFSDQEVPPPTSEEIAARLDPVVSSLEKWLTIPDAGSQRGAPHRFLLWGRANAGKSTLLNALCGDEYAIVTPLAGTTTDPVSAQIQASSSLVEIVDLPGRQPIRDAIEESAEQIAGGMLAEGDPVLDGLDASREVDELRREWDSLPAEIRSRARPVLNQIDRLHASDLVELPNWPTRCLTSALKGEVEEVRTAIEERVQRGDSIGRAAGLFFNDRQRRGVELCRSRLERAIASSSDSDFVEPELTVVELREAHSALEEMTGELATEETLNRIFSRFCVGK